MKKKETVQTEESPKIDKTVVIRQNKSCDSGNMVWGLMFIFAGVIFLLNNMGIVPWSIWNEIWRFWPVLLIFSGVHMILGEGLLARIIMAILIITTLLSIVGFALRESGSVLFREWGFNKIPWLYMFNYLR